ncbi:hypothetical protein [Croceimicrobium hydrocarbonivorans]|uniref:Uncharacterized protein n=1 Tax=Croceimicrobium hydrocarbonivorans TaxID=2761580 RepID=A0A7H0VHT0_9FLAO|nr:hypothetical protein [Croceimicrobium hydrocarbonivorans]QNR25278.1 hypothetical protein H4K34_05410 [Croceimicrobium hydrocarbonivorans]
MNISSAQQELLDRIKDSMLDYIADEEAAYSAEEVKQCLSLLKNFLNEMDAAGDREAGMKAVEKTVLALNDLNAKCDYELIETDQREDVCELIIKAGEAKGFNDEHEDITEEWREW